MLALLVLGGTRVLYGAILSRVTSHDAFGIIGELVAISMISSYLLPAGIGSAISRFVPYSMGGGDPALALSFYRLLSRAAEVAALLLGIAAAGVAFVVLGRPWQDAVAVGVVAATYSLYTTEKAGLYGFGRVSAYVRLEIAASTLTLLVTIVVAVSRSWFLLPLAIGYGAFVLGARWTLRGDAHGATGAPSRRDKRELALYVGLACLGTVASAGFLQGTQLIAASFVTASEVAYFTAAVTMVTPLYFLPRALALALFPSMSEAHGGGDRDAIRRHTDLSTRGLLVVLAPLIVVAELVAPELLTVFGGTSYAAGSAVLEVMVGAAFIAVVQVASVNALSSGAGWQLRIPVGWAVSGFFTGLLVAAALGPRLGAVGVAIAYLVGTTVTAAGPIAVVWRRYSMPWTGPFLRAFGPVLAAAIVSLVIGSPAAGATAGWVVHLGLAVAGCLVTLLVLRPDVVTVLRRLWAGRSEEGPQLSTLP